MTASFHLRAGKRSCKLSKSLRSSPGSLSCELHRFHAERVPCTRLPEPSRAPRAQLATRGGGGGWVESPAPLQIDLPHCAGTAHTAANHWLARVRHFLVGGAFQTGRSLNQQVALCSARRGPGRALHVALAVRSSHPVPGVLAAPPVPWSATLTLRALFVGSACICKRQT